ncbi:MAG: imidazoleglycerol-phosphate dehydratase HisB [Chloroflexota bacterium]
MSRVGTSSRETRETSIAVRWDVDGTGVANISTGIGFLDHMLESLARHGRFDITVQAKGDLHIDDHHTVEDIGIGLGRALAEALGERRGIRRFGHAIVPLDEALSMASVDLSGRGNAFVELGLKGPSLGTLATEMVPHFFLSLAQEARVTLHVHSMLGANDHHRVESAFKSVARALDDATRYDERIAGEIPSTKGALD